jgi:hypothetical protein
MRRILVAIVATLIPLAGTTAWAESTPEFRMFAGAYVPTGKQADVLKSDMLVGAQGGIELAKMVHLIGTFAYATPRPDRSTIGKDVHLYQYDVGVELFQVYAASEANDHWTFRPFLGMGLGGRTYDLQDVASGSETNLVGYGALGTEFQHLRIAARLEARDYVSQFKGLTGNESASTRNDLVLGGGLAFHF